MDKAAQIKMETPTTSELNAQQKSHSIHCVKTEPSIDIVDVIVDEKLRVRCKGESHCDSNLFAGAVIYNEKLIELVQQHQELYDAFHPKYKDVNHKERLWTIIGKDLHINVDTCKKRWQNIRDNYRKSLRRRSKYGQIMDPTKIMKYKFEDQLQFLHPFLNEKESTGTNIDDEMIFQAEDNQIDTKDGKEHTIDCGYPTVDNVVNSIDDCTSINESPLLLRKKMNIDPVTPSTLMKHILEHNRLSMPEQRHPVDDFLAGLAPILKTLTPYYLNMARTKIFNAIQEIELTQIVQMPERYSNQLPSGALSHIQSTSTVQSQLSDAGAREPMEPYDRGIDQQSNEQIAKDNQPNGC